MMWNFWSPRGGDSCGPLEVGDCDIGMALFVDDPRLEFFPPAMPVGEWSGWAKAQVASLLDELLGWEELEGSDVEHALALFRSFHTCVDDDVVGGEWRT